MNDDDLGAFPQPPFKAFDALEQIKRSLRDLKLAERGQGFELRGKPVLELRLDDNQINVRIARKLALTPEWDRQAVNSTTSQRKLLDEIKRRLERWQDVD